MLLGLWGWCSLAAQSTSKLVVATLASYSPHHAHQSHAMCAYMSEVCAPGRRSQRALQGMNFVAGTMLLFMEEEDAFWALAAVVEDLLPGYFAMDLIAPQVDQAVFKHLVRGSGCQRVGATRLCLHCLREAMCELACHTAGPLRQAPTWAGAQAWRHCTSTSADAAALDCARL